jgi:putative copper resistance protein D
VNLAAGLIASRFVHYLALSVLFGGALFPFYGMALHAEQPRVPVWLVLLLRAAAVLVLLSGISWLLFTAAGMSGSITGLTDPSVLSTVLFDTDFGHVWALRLLLASGLAVLALSGRMGGKSYYLLLAGSLVLLASIALTGHAESDAGRFGFLHRAADAVHLIAAGVWIGALLVLTRLIVMAARGSSAEALAQVHHALAQFSGTGTAVVVALLVTGLINPGFLASLSSLYGRVLLAKLGIFGCMLMLAAANRFWLTPRLGAAMQTGNGSRAAVRMLRASVVTETMLALVVLLAVAWLGTLAPP